MKKQKNKLIFFVILLFILFLIFVPSQKIKLKSYDKIVPLKVLVADKGKTKENVSLDDMNSGDIDQILYFSIGNLNLKKKGNYYVGDLYNVNDILLEDITDYVFAENNASGTVLKNCKFDKKTKKIKIPISIFENKEEIPVQFEFLSRVDKDKFNNIPIYVSVSRIDKNKKTSYVSGYDVTTTFSIANYKQLMGVSQNEISVYVNNNKKLSQSDFGWDPVTGNIEIAVNPILVKNVNVVIDKKTVITNILGIMNVKAVKYSSMKTYAKLDSEPNVSNGDVFNMSLSQRIAYLDFTTSNLSKCETISKSDKKWSKYQTCKNGWKYGYGYGGSYAKSYVATDSNKSSFLLTAKNVDEDGNVLSTKATIYLDFLVKLTDFKATSKSKVIDFKLANGNPLWVALACYHSGYGYDTSFSSISGVQIKILSKTNSYVIVGFKTETTYSQNGFGIYKFKWSEEKLGAVKAVKKYLDGNGNDTGSTTPVTFSLYEDSTSDNVAACSPSTYLATETTVNGVATFDELELGEYYYVSETSPSGWTTKSGFECVRTPNPLTENSAEDSALKVPTEQTETHNVKQHKCVTVQKKSDVSSIKGQTISGVPVTFQIWRNMTNMVLEAQATASNNYTITAGPFEDNGESYTYIETINGDPNYYNDNSYHKSATTYPASYAATDVNHANPYCAGGTVNTATNTHKKFCTRIVKKDKTTDNIIRAQSSFCSSKLLDNKFSRYNNVTPNFCNSFITSKTLSSKQPTFNVYYDENGTDLATTVKTNEYGLGAIANLYLYQDYYMREVEFPDGYPRASRMIKIPKESLHEYYSTDSQNYREYCNDFPDASGNYTYNGVSHNTGEATYSETSDTLNVYYFHYVSPFNENSQNSSIDNEENGDIKKGLLNAINNLNRIVKFENPDAEDKYKFFDIPLNSTLSSGRYGSEILQNSVSNFADRYYILDTIRGNRYGIIIGNDVFTYSNVSQPSLKFQTDDYNIVYNLGDLGISGYSNYFTFFNTYLSEATTNPTSSTTPTNNVLYTNYNITPDVGYVDGENNVYYDYVQTNMGNTIANSVGTANIYFIQSAYLNENIDNMRTSGCSLNVNKEDYDYFDGDDSAQQKAICNHFKMYSAIKDAIDDINSIYQKETAKSNVTIINESDIVFKKMGDLYGRTDFPVYYYHIYGEIFNKIAGNNYFSDEFVNTNSRLNSLSFYNSDILMYPYVIINNKLYYYPTDSYYSSNNMSYINENTFKNYDELKEYFYNIFLRELRYDVINDDIPTMEEEVFKYIKSFSTEGYTLIVNGQSDDPTVIENSIPVYNYKYILNWYKVTETDKEEDNASFIVQNKTNGKYVRVEANKETFTDNNNIKKTCYVLKDEVNGESNASTLISYNTNSNNSSSPGEACIIGMEEGTYRIIEKNPGKYHTFGDRDYLEIASSDKFYQKNQAKFTNYETEFIFTKSVSSGNDGIWENITLQELRKIPFNITDSNGNLISFIKKSDGLYEYANNDVDPISGTNTTTTDLYLNNSKQFKVVHLPIGTYNVKEKRTCCDSACPSCTGTEECTGFYYPKYSKSSDYQFTISTCSSSKTTASTCKTASAATQNLINIPTKIEFTKKDLYGYADATSTVKFEDEEERTAFDDITFKLKDSSGNYMKLVKVGNYGNCKSDDSYSEYRYVPSSMLGSMQTTEELHTCGGHIHITHLCRGKKYTIEEYAVPDNTVFTLPDAHIFKDYYLPYTEDGKACCDNPTNSPNTTTTIEDTPTRIFIQKTNNRLNENIKEGESKKDSYDNSYIGKFKVYKCAKTVSTCTYDSSDKKAIKFLDLMLIDSDREDPGEKVYKYVLDQSVTGGYVQELKLNENGKLILRYLPANYKYVVVEENAPAGYYNLHPSSNALANLEVGVAKNTTNKNFNFVNYPTIIEFNKDDIYKYYKSSDLDKINSNIKIFDSMTFKLHDYKGNVVKLQKVTDGDYRYIQDNGNVSANNVTELHTKDGKMVITNLHRNQTYYLEETKADTLGNFILPNNINNTSLIDSDAGSFKNNKHPIVRYDIPKNIEDETKKNSAPLSLTKLIENLPTRVVFEKRDKRTGELIDDEKNILLNQGKTDTDQSGINYGNIRTTFNVYYCEKTSENDTSPCEIDESRKVYFKERQYIKDANNNDITSDITSIEAPVLAYEYSKLNNSANAISDLITDRGLLVLAYLPSEYKYVLYEKTAPNGYYQPDERDENLKIQFRVNGSSLETGETYTKLTSINENTPTEIMFIKSDFYDYYNEEDVANLDTEIKLFDTARFVLRDSEGNILNLKEVETNEEEGHVYRYLPLNEENTHEKIYTYKGRLKITHLYRNSVYYIEEVETTDPKHFILPDYMQFEGLPFDNKGHPVVKYIVPNSKPDDAITVTKEIENIPTRVRFEKRDSKYNYLIPDETTTFKVYQCKKDEEGNNTDCHPTDENDENSVLMTFDERHVLSGTNMYGISHKDQEDPTDAEGLEGVEVYTYAKLNQGSVTDLHPYHGILILRYLPADYDYVLVETVAPKNYTLPKGRDAETKFTIVDNTVYIDANDVPNVPTSLIIKKYSSETGNLLAGAEFKIYEAQTTCNYNQEPWAQTGLKELKLKTIRDGVYEARPEADTTIVKTCHDKEGALCSEIPTNLNTSLTYMEYAGEDSWADFSNIVVKERENNDEKLGIHEGEALIQYLEYGHCYVIEETKAPIGYSLPNKKKDRFTMIHIEENEQYGHDTQFVFKNTPTPFTFYKYDEFNELLDGAEFKLQKLNDDKKYEDIKVTEEEKEAGLFYKYEGLAKEGDNTVIHTKDGKATVYYLPAGQYRIVETKAAPGKELTKNPNIATFFVDEVGNTFGNAIVVNKSETKKIIPKNSASAELIVNIQTGQVIIRYSAIIITLLSLVIGLMFVRKKIK